MLAYYSLVIRKQGSGDYVHTQRQLPQIRCGSTQITSASSDERHLSCTQDEGGGDKHYRARK